MTALNGAPARPGRTWLAVLCALILVPLTSFVGAAVGNFFLSAVGDGGIGTNVAWDTADWPILLLSLWAPRFIAGLIAGLLAMGIVGLIFRRARMATVAWVTTLLCLVAAAVIVLLAWPHLSFDPRFVGFLSFGLGLVLGLLILSGSRR